MLIPFLTYPDHCWGLELDKAINGNFVYDEIRVGWNIDPEEKNRNGNTTIHFNVSCIAFKGDKQFPMENLNLFKLTRKAVEIIEKNNLNWIQY